jgi:hypothetical protein
VTSFTTLYRVAEDWYDLKRMNGNGEAARARFALGRTVVTANAMSKLSDEDIQSALSRHHIGDWGDLDSHDRQANETALKDGSRLLSAYRTQYGEKFWIITEADRSMTTVLMPQDY